MDNEAWAFSTDGRLQIEAHYGRPDLDVERVPAR